MELPQDLIKINKPLKQKIIRTPEQLKADEQRRLFAISEQFKDANRMTEKAQNELDALREEHKQNMLLKDESKSESFNTLQTSQSNDNSDAILNVSNQIKELSSALKENLRGENNPKKTLELKNHLRELTNNLSSLQDEMNQMEVGNTNNGSNNANDANDDNENSLIQENSIV